MKRFLAKLLIALFAVTTVSCGEELYDAAKRYSDGLNFVVALVQDGGR
jgi:hypothetical protein